MLLQAFEDYLKDASTKLGRKVEDLEDVRFVMSMLKEVCSLYPMASVHNFWTIQ